MNCKVRNLLCGLLAVASILFVTGCDWVVVDVIIPGYGGSPIIEDPYDDGFFFDFYADF